MLSKPVVLFFLLLTSFNLTYSQTKLVGVTRIGSNGAGSIFSMPTGGTTLSTFYNLALGEGSFPTGSLVMAPNGKYYGLNSGVYEYDYTNDKLTQKYVIGNNPVTEAAFSSSLVLASNGKFYATSFSGGTNAQGLIYQYDYINNIYTKKIDLALSTGVAPTGSLVEANGKMYGMTSAGGSNNRGVIFEYDFMNNIYTKKIDLNTNGGCNPYGSLFYASNGKMYGMTDSGGVNNKGVIFEYDYINNLYTKKIDLDAANGSNPVSTLMQAANGKLYGMTTKGGANGAGVIFEYDFVNNSYLKKYDLTSANGITPTGRLIEVTNGLLYGQTESGGELNSGALFKYNYLNNVYTLLKSFSNALGAGCNTDGFLASAPNGKLYGLNEKGGIPRDFNDGLGSMFEFDYTNNVYRKVANFGASKDGETPQGSLMLAPNGKTYGVTYRGGTYSTGVIYEYDYQNNTYTKKIDFNDDALDYNGQYPFSSLTAASNGKAYGTTRYGGTFGWGLIYEYDIANNIYTKKLEMPSSAGRAPNGMIQASNGKLFGMTAAQIASGSSGTIFEYDYNANTCIKKIDLSVVNGYNSTGALVQASNGKIYGMTNSGGTTNGGVLFEYDYNTNTCTQKYDFNQGAKGMRPYGSLIQAANGKLYGLASQGGANSFGVIFEYDYTNNTYTKLFDFNGANGSNPYGSFFQASNNKLYGTTYQGGANNLGTVFEYDYTTSTFTLKKSFNGPDGSQPFDMSFIEVPDVITCTIIAGITNNTGTTVLSCAVSSINVTATGGLTYSWNNGLGNNANAIITAPGTYTVTATDGNGCIGKDSITVTQIPAVPATPTTVIGPVNICAYAGTQTQIIYSVPHDPSATSHLWTVSPAIHLVSGQGTDSIAITIDTSFLNTPNRQIKVIASSSCGSSAQFIKYLAAQAPNTPGPITASSSNICAIMSTSNTITYSISSVSGASGYIWNIPTGATAVHPGGSGVNDTIVILTFSASFFTSQLTVQAVNSCGASGPRNLTLTTNTPAAPGLISGPTNACEFIAPNGVAATYSVPNVSGTTYTWTVPAGSTALTGQGTNSISFIFPNGFTTGVVSVTATNGCGTSPARTLNINVLSPAVPANIGSTLVQGCPSRIYSYTIVTMPVRATSVLWTVPAGATIISGQGGVTITVSYPASGVTGAVTAQSISNCANSNVRTYNIILPACSPAGPRATAKTMLPKAELGLPVDEMKVNVFPNPTNSEFKFNLVSASKQVATIKISDVQGREIKKLNLLPGESIYYGNELRAGIYLVEVRQGNIVKTSRIVKL